MKTCCCSNEWGDKDAAAGGRPTAGRKFVRNLHEPMGGEFMQIYEFVFGILFPSLKGLGRGERAKGVDLGWQTFANSR